MPTPVSELSAAATIALAALSAAVLIQPCRADPNPLPGPLMEHHCNACHAVDDALIGPPLIAVAARYGSAANQQRTIEVLAEKVRHGGAGNWGIVPMVPNNLSADEARRLVVLILALKPPPG